MAELYGRPWALALYRDGPQLLALEGEMWAPVDDGGALPDLTSARHVGFAFDQAARPVLTWERAGAVFVRQFDGTAGQYVTRGPFPGRDPVLICDALLMGRSDTSDVLLLVLDGPALVVRVQREQYATTRILAAVPPDSVLDQVVPTGLAWTALGEGPDGAALAWRSRDYPVIHADALAGSVSLTGALLDMLHRVAAQDTLTTSQTISGAFVLVSTSFTVSDTVMTSQVLGGSLAVVVVARALTDTVTTSQVVGGSLVVVGVPVVLADAVTTSQTITGAFS